MNSAFKDRAENTFNENRIGQGWLITDKELRTSSGGYYALVIGDTGSQLFVRCPYCGHIHGHNRPDVTSEGYGIDRSSGCRPSIPGTYTFGMFNSRLKIVDWNPDEKVRRNA